MGSAAEVDYQLQLAADLNYIASTDYARLNAQLTETKKILNAFIKKLKATRQ